MKSTPISEFVKERRRANRLTQIELAAKAGVGLRFIRDMEQGKASLRTDTVNKVLQLFGKQLGPTDLPREESPAPAEIEISYLDKLASKLRKTETDRPKPEPL